MKVVRKPIEQQAWLVSEFRFMEEIPRVLMDFVDRQELFPSTRPLQVRTKAGLVHAKDTDYLILSVTGDEVYPCDPDTFVASFDVVDDVLDEEPETVVD